MSIVQQETGMQLSGEVMSSVVLNGDVSKLKPEQKVSFYIELCKRVGIDPATQPFKLLKLNGKEIFYADKSATQQLSKLHNISHEIVKRERVEDVYVVTVRATSNGRYTDEDGAVTIGNAKGDALANALMKATTKAKRRAVLALMGLGMLDESEIETIPNAVTVEMHKTDTSVNDAVVVEKKTPDFSDETEKRSKALTAISKASSQATLDKITAQAEKYYTEGVIGEEVYGEINNEITKKSLELTPLGEK